ncbi:MAG: hypothetical protein AAF915_08710 [Cyanobacteria bacterium P01_D01_bin.50]
MAAIRKSNLRGKKRWLRQDSTPKETNIRGSRVNEYTSLPPFPKSTPEFLSRQRHYKPSLFSKNSSSINSNNLSSPRVRSQRINSNNVNNKSREYKNQKAIPVMPDGSKVPIWLMRWNSFHRKTSIVTFLLVATTLIVYGWTVYSQHLWSRSYKQLQELQRDERQLTKHDEMLKHKMAQEAEKPRSGLVSPTPANTIFLQETTPLNSRDVEKESGKTEPPPSNALGY